MKYLKIKAGTELREGVEGISYNIESDMTTLELIGMLEHIKIEEMKKRFVKS